MNFLEKITYIKNNIKDCPFCGEPFIKIGEYLIYCNQTICSTVNGKKVYLNNFYLNISISYFQIKYKDNVLGFSENKISINHEIKLDIKSDFISINFPFINEEKVKTLLVFQ